MRSLARSVPRVALAALVVVGAPLLSACEQIENFELFDTKKKLPGDRKPVFPDGVPGVASGVPPELMKGYREPEGAAPADPAKAAAEAAAAEHQQSAPKPKPAPQRTASKPPAAPAAAAPAKPAASSSNSSSARPPPPQGAPLPWPTSPPAQAQAPWPGAPPASTATR